MVIQKSGLVAHAGTVDATFFGPTSSLFNPLPAVQLSSSTWPDPDLASTLRFPDTAASPGATPNIARGQLLPT